MIEVLTGAYKQTPLRIVSKLYRGLLKQQGRNTVYIKVNGKRNLTLSCLGVTGSPYLRPNIYQQALKDGGSLVGKI